MKRTLTWLLCGAAVLVARTGSASTIDMTLDGMGYRSVVAIHSPHLGDVWVYAGEMKWSWTDETPPGYQTDFYTYCVDANSYEAGHEPVELKTTDTLMTTWSTPSPDAGYKAAWLFNTYASGIHAETGPHADTDAAALQIAIWASLYNTGDVAHMLDGTTNAFRVLWATGSVRNKAQSYLDSLFSSDYLNAHATWLDTDPNLGQDQITYLPDLPVIANPEPASLVLCGTGLLAAFARRRQLRRRNS